MKPFFSLVIPCYNDGRYAPGMYIDRLLTSVLEQGLEKDDIEVIISDDHSKIPYQGTLDRYRDKLNIKFVETDYNFAPGNTRQKGTEVAEGRWLCFADHDDVFYSGSLSKVKAAIEQSDIKYMVYTDFNKVDSKNLDKVVEEFRRGALGTWVHGKFYNLANFWRPFNLHFVKDLKTHEDLALGREVECALHKLGENPFYLQEVTYKWIWNKDSVSHGEYIAKKGPDGVVHDFLETHFNDFLISQVDVILDCYKEDQVTRNEAIALTVGGLGTAFMSNCTFKIKNPENYLKTIDAYSSRVLHRMESELDLKIVSLKVMIQKSFPEMLTKVNKMANDYYLPTFLEWLTELDKMDYQSIIDEYNKPNEPVQEQVVVNEPEAVDENQRPFFSVVIACYNDGRYKKGVYLDRLLSSLEHQGLAKHELEVVLSDDCSPVPFDDIVKAHEDKLIIKRTKTDYNCCPGNTRAKGVEIATGEWLCFADHDDIYYEEGMLSMKNAIKEKNEQHFAFADFLGVTPEGKLVRKYEGTLNWCHGKFYNKDNFWDKYNIHFIKDLKSHEDIAICTQVSCVLSTELKNYTYLHKPVYAWTDNPQSVSHAKYTIDTEDGPREFLEVFFDDYLHSTGYLYIEKFREHSIKMANAIKGCLEIMCYAYFYTQGFQFRRPDDFYKKNLEIAGEYIDICKKTFNMTNQSMYNAIASNSATMYYQVRKLANPGSGRYIPTQTLKQWFDLVSPEKKRRGRKKVEKPEKA